MKGKVGCLSRRETMIATLGKGTESEDGLASKVLTPQDDEQAQN